MISSNYDFERFVEAIREKGYYEVVYMAEQEATEAWRTSYRSKKKRDNGESSQYQQKLIGLIEYLRHGIKPRSLSDKDIEICRGIEPNPELRQVG